MSDTPPDQVIAALEETWSATAQMCETLHPDAWDLPTDCPGWSVRDHLSHLIGTELGLLGTAAPAQPEPMPAHVRNPIGQNNEAWIEARRGVPGTEVLAEFVSATTRRLEELSSFAPERWSTPGWSPIGEAPYGEFMLMRIMDSWVHGQDMRRAVDRPGDRGGRGETVALARLTSGMGYVVGRQVGPPDGTTVVFNIEGLLPRVVAIGMAGTRAEALAAPPDAPTVRLTMPAEHFVRLACGRETADEAVAAGGVATEGDEALGRKIIGSMNFMI
ncbi:MAG: maleylpyruvate isomerase family mycothiol-dependent enzyme [Acidimicrobiales bacterium]